MPTYTDEQKKQRKHTIKAREQLRIMDGDFIPRPSFDIVQHPRAYNKPISCQLGKHHWVNKVIMGCPFLYCTKCGAGTPRDVYYGTLSNREMKANVPDAVKNINKTDDIQKLVEKINARSKK